MFDDMAEIRILVPFWSTPGNGSMDPVIILGIRIKHPATTGSGAGRFTGTKIFPAGKLPGFGTNEFIAERTVSPPARAIPNHRQGRDVGASRDTVLVDAGDAEILGSPGIELNNGENMP